MLTPPDEKVALEGFEILKHVADGGVEDAVCAVGVGVGVALTIAAAADGAQAVALFVEFLLDVAEEVLVVGGSVGELSLILERNGSLG
jgi:hypothetical protein